MTRWIQNHNEWLWFLVSLILGLYAAAYFVTALYDVPLTADALRFERPWAAFLLLAGPVSLVAHHFAKRIRPRLLFSQAAAAAKSRTTLKQWFADLPTGLRASTLSLISFALMGPQSIHARSQSEVEGIDIALVLDMSGSMEAADVQPNRFEALKDVVADFLLRRPNDRIGAVVFGRDAYTLMPLTVDKHALRTVLEDLTLDLVDGRGTAIGNGVGTGLNRLRSSRAQSKVIILVTDGDSNAGNVSPDQATELAATMGVKIYSILMGVRDDAPVAQGVDLLGQTIMGVAQNPVNPELLQRMSNRTGGEYFAVSDRRALESSFHRILDALERSKIEDVGAVYGELFRAFLIPAIAFVLLEVLLRIFLLRRWP